MITEGSVCVWQNQVGEWEYLNGVETTVLKGLHYAKVIDFHGISRGTQLVYATDTPHPESEGRSSMLYAAPHELRLKDGLDDPEEDEYMDLLFYASKLEVVREYEHDE